MVPAVPIGLTESLPIYSGGLGILAGDHLKSASELGLPLVGVGLLYQKGYFRQYLNPEGWQQERNPVNDFSTMAVRPFHDGSGQPVRIGVDVGGRTVVVRPWRVEVGRVTLVLLDSNGNPVLGVAEVSMAGGLAAAWPVRGLEGLAPTTTVTAAIVGERTVSTW